MDIQSIRSQRGTAERAITRRSREVWRQVKSPADAIWGALAGASSEVALLLASIGAARPPSSALDFARIDGERLLELADQHAVLPLLYRHLAAHQHALPAPFMPALRARYQASVREALLLAAEMVRLTELLEAHGIPTVPFKGPALAAYAHGDLALRPAGDLDLLIRRGDFVRARELVVAEGFRPLLELSAQEERAYLAEHNDFAFEHPVTKLVLELQWCVVQSPFVFPPDIDAWWGRLERAKLSGRAVRAFSAEDLLLILCVHGGKHAWERLLWVNDVAALLRAHPTIDWPRVFERAQQCNSLRMLRLGLLLALELCGAPLSADLAADIRADGRLALLALDVVRRLERASGGEELFDQTPLFYVRARESWREKLRILWACYPNLRHPVRLWQQHRPSSAQLRQHGQQFWRRLVRH